MTARPECPTLDSLAEWEVGSGPGLLFAVTMHFRDRAVARAWAGWIANNEPAPALATTEGRADG